MGRKQVTAEGGHSEEDKVCGARKHKGQIKKD
jgi:hypothetical protein